MFGVFRHNIIVWPVIYDLECAYCETELAINNRYYNIHQAAVIARVIESDFSLSSNDALHITSTRTIPVAETRRLRVIRSTHNILFWINTFLETRITQTRAIHAGTLRAQIYRACNPLHVQRTVRLEVDK
jgi:hypothetical protein